MSFLRKSSNNTLSCVSEPPLVPDDVSDLSPMELSVALAELAGAVLHPKTHHESMSIVVKLLSRGLVRELVRYLCQGHSLGARRATRGVRGLLAARGSRADYDLLLSTILSFIDVLLLFSTNPCTLPWLPSYSPSPLSAPPSAPSSYIPYAIVHELHSHLRACPTCVLAALLLARASLHVPARAHAARCGVPLSAAEAARTDALPRMVPVSQIAMPIMRPTITYEPLEPLAEPSDSSDDTTDDDALGARPSRPARPPPTITLSTPHLSLDLGAVRRGGGLTLTQRLPLETAPGADSAAATLGAALGAAFVGSEMAGSTVLAVRSRPPLTAPEGQAAVALAADGPGDDHLASDATAAPPPPAWARRARARSDPDWYEVLGAGATTPPPPPPPPLSFPLLLEERSELHLRLLLVTGALVVTDQAFSQALVGTVSAALATITFPCPSLTHPPAPSPAATAACAEVVTTVLREWAANTISYTTMTSALTTALGLVGATASPHVTASGVRGAALVAAALSALVPVGRALDIQHAFSHGVAQLLITTAATAASRLANLSSTSAPLISTTGLTTSCEQMVLMKPGRTLQRTLLDADLTLLAQMPTRPVLYMKTHPFSALRKFTAVAAQAVHDANTDTLTLSGTDLETGAAVINVCAAILGTAGRRARKQGAPDTVLEIALSALAVLAAVTSRIMVIAATDLDSIADAAQTLGEAVCSLASALWPHCKACPRRYADAVFDNTAFHRVVYNLALTINDQTSLPNTNSLIPDSALITRSVLATATSLAGAISSIVLPPPSPLSQALVWRTSRTSAFFGISTATVPAADGPEIPASLAAQLVVAGHEPVAPILASAHSVLATPHTRPVSASTSRSSHSQWAEPADIGFAPCSAETTLAPAPPTRLGAAGLACPHAFAEPPPPGPAPPPSPEEALALAPAHGLRRPYPASRPLTATDAVANRVLPPHCVGLLAHVGAGGPGFIHPALSMRYVFDTVTGFLPPLVLSDDPEVAVMAINAIETFISCPTNPIVVTEEFGSGLVAWLARAVYRAVGPRAAWPVAAAALRALSTALTVHHTAALCTAVRRSGLVQTLSVLFTNERTFTENDLGQTMTSTMQHGAPSSAPPLLSLTSLQASLPPSQMALPALPGVPDIDENFDSDTWSSSDALSATPPPPPPAALAGLSLTLSPSVAPPPPAPAPAATAMTTDTDAPALGPIDAALASNHAGTVALLGARRHTWVYATRDLHMASLTFMFAVLITPRAILDPEYTDQFPLNRGLPDILNDLLAHLSHPLNASLVPSLADILSTRHMTGACRLLRLLAPPLFNPAHYPTGQWEFVARGGYGAVYRLPGPGLAIKVVSGSSDDRCVVHDVFTEVAAMERFRGAAGVVQLVDFGCVKTDSGNQFWLVMKNYRNSLSAWRRQLFGSAAPGQLRHTRSLMDNTLLLMDVYLAVLLAHLRTQQGNIIHFDIKCDNILLEPATTAPAFPTAAPASAAPRAAAFAAAAARAAALPFAVAVADFGESKLFSDESQAMTSRTRGTEFIKAPEMLLTGAPPELGGDRRALKGAALPADAWALACLLYELLTGSYLFQDDDWLTFFKDVTAGTGLGARREGMLGKYEPFINFFKRALIREPRKRPTIAELVVMANDLRNTVERDMKVGIKWCFDLPPQPDPLPTARLPEVTPAPPALPQVTTACAGWWWLSNPDPLSQPAIDPALLVPRELAPGIFTAPAATSTSISTSVTEDPHTMTVPCHNLHHTTAPADVAEPPFVPGLAALPPASRARPPAPAPAPVRWPSLSSVMAFCEWAVAAGSSAIAGDNSVVFTDSTGTGPSLLAALAVLASRRHLPGRPALICAAARGGGILPEPISEAFCRWADARYAAGHHAAPAPLLRGDGRPLLFSCVCGRYVYEIPGPPANRGFYTSVGEALDPLGAPPLPKRLTAPVTAAAVSGRLGAELGAESLRWAVCSAGRVPGFCTKTTKQAGNGLGRKVYSCEACQMPLMAVHKGMHFYCTSVFQPYWF